MSLVVGPMGSRDPTEVFVDQLPLGLPEFALGSVLLVLYVVIQTLALPLNFIKDLKPVNYRVVRTPENAFIPSYTQGYNFKSNYLNIRGFPRVHFLDEGNRSADRTLVLLHGEPFWSYSFLKIIPYFVHAGYRVIVPDFIGFGKSDKYVDYRAYNVSLHKATLGHLFHYIQPKGEITLVGHNWGWLIGAAFAKDFPGFFTKFVILNTNNVPDGEITLGRYRSPTALGKIAIIDSFFLVFNASINLLRSLFPYSLLIKSLNINYTHQEVKGFLTPFGSLSERGGATAFPLMVPVYPNHPNAAEMRDTREYLSRCNVPTLVIYSEASLLPWITKGDFVVGNRQSFYSLLMKSVVDVHRVPDSGHLVMYDQPELVAHLIINFLNRRPSY